jgi:hypothetical protein
VHYGKVEESTSVSLNISVMSGGTEILQPLKYENGT